MSITTATSQMEPELRALWHRVFHDSAQFIDLFFTRRFVPSNTWVAVEENRPVSMLFLLPLTVKAGTRIYSARYIYAVGTDPGFRARGLSGALIREVHTQLAKDGVSLSLLVPASTSLFEYYAKRGFATQFYTQTRSVSADLHKSALHIALEPTQLPQHRTQRDAYFASDALYACWDEAALAYQEQEAQLSGGGTLAFDGGYALCYPRQDDVLIKEWVAPTDDREILRAIARYYQKPKVVVRTAADASSGVPFGMTCWYGRKDEGSGECPPVLSLVLD